MNAKEYSELKVGDFVTVKVKITKLFPKKTLGAHRGWAEGVVVADGMIGEQHVTINAQHADLGRLKLELLERMSALIGEVLKQCPKRLAMSILAAAKTEVE